MEAEMDAGEKRFPVGTGGSRGGGTFLREAVFFGAFDLHDAALMVDDLDEAETEGSDLLAEDFDPFVGGSFFRRNDWGGGFVFFWGQIRHGISPF